MHVEVCDGHAHEVLYFSASRMESSPRCFRFRCQSSQYWSHCETCLRETKADECRKSTLSSLQLMSIERIYCGRDILVVDYAIVIDI